MGGKGFAPGVLWKATPKWTLCNECNDAAQIWSSVLRIFKDQRRRMDIEDNKNQPKMSRQQPAQPGTTIDSQNNPTQTGETERDRSRYENHIARCFDCATAGRRQDQMTKSARSKPKLLRSSAKTE
jgi:hypothetical protein